VLTLALFSAQSMGIASTFKDPEILKMRYSTILLALFCVACGNYSANVPTIKPYKMDIQQGNVVTAKMMMQLRPGMTKSQVRFLMGTPLLVDSFHSDRWDYFYQMRKDGKIIEQRRIILDFDGDSLAHVRGDVIPAGTDPAAVADDKPKSMQPKSVTKPAVKEKGMLDKLKFWGDDEEQKTVPREQVKPEAKSPPTPEQKPDPEAAPTREVVAPEKPVVAREKVKPAETEEKKGWLDKLKFWGDEDKATPKATPKPETRTIAPTKPMEPTKPVEEPRIEQPKTDVPTAETVMETPKSEPKVSAPTAAEPAPAPRRPSLPDAAPKAPPKPAADLPPEDSPDFFEKMLEKIGF